ncbi:hypothetical protein GCM10010269_80520 [Streptomyces humidus]|uniref:Uncharacterized protein n=1 Tax=Streptomyces humidus TaxID=52259 RepID=A0A918LBR6_9ACTN|nr:hypothetical protein [Streptomyces humidus]GGS29786.1 hypothetical protein GCM10010269_80520 [Streptomyces humidus]
MNGLNLTLRALHHGEKHLAGQLTAVAERHRTEHEIHHVATDLAVWSRDHVAHLAETADARGVHLGGSSGASTAGVLSALREKAAEAMAHRPEPGLLLLRDLRELHLGAAENSLHWEMLAQAAQAARDERLLVLVSRCHPQTLRQMRWTNTMIKNLAPQILTSF